MDPRLANQAIMQHHQNINNTLHVEESADELIRKLENQGKRIKIINDDDDNQSELNDASPKK